MKTSILKSLVTTLSILCLVVGANPLSAAQPQKNEAIEHLHEAKKSEHPIVQLEKAKKHLEESAPDRHHDRKQAIHHVNEAIVAARKGEHKAMEIQIDKAIEEARESKHDTKRKK